MHIFRCVDFFINFITWKIQFLYLSCPPHLKFLINIVLNTSLNLYYLIWTILLIYLRLGRSYSVCFLTSPIWCFKKYYTLSSNFLVFSISCRLRLAQACCVVLQWCYILIDLDFIKYSLHESPLDLTGFHPKFFSKFLASLSGNVLKSICFFLNPFIFSTLKSRLSLLHQMVQIQMRMQRIYWNTFTFSLQFSTPSLIGIISMSANKCNISHGLPWWLLYILPSRTTFYFCHLEHMIKKKTLLHRKLFVFNKYTLYLL